MKYKYIGITEGVCGNRPVVLGTRLEPKFIVEFGSAADTMEKFSLSVEQVEECYWFEFERNGENEI